MRYCRRTFFNTIMQPNRIGKAIFKLRGSRLISRIHFDREYYFHKWKPRNTMVWYRRGKTPINGIISRYSKVRHYKWYHLRGLRTAQSIFVRRAKRYATT